MMIITASKPVFISTCSKKGDKDQLLFWETSLSSTVRASVLAVMWRQNSIVLILKPAQTGWHTVNSEHRVSAVQERVQTCINCCVHYWFDVIVKSLQGQQSCATENHKKNNTQNNVLVQMLINGDLISSWIWIFQKEKIIMKKSLKIQKSSRLTGRHDTSPECEMKMWTFIWFVTVRKGHNVYGFPCFGITNLTQGG